MSFPTSGNYFVLGNISEDNPPSDYKIITLADDASLITNSFNPNRIPEGAYFTISYPDPENHPSWIQMQSNANNKYVTIIEEFNGARAAAISPNVNTLILSESTFPNPITIDGETMHCLDIHDNQSIFIMEIYEQDPNYIVFAEYSGGSGGGGDDKKTQRWVFVKTDTTSPEFPG